MGYITTPPTEEDHFREFIYKCVVALGKSDGVATRLYRTLKRNDISTLKQFDNAKILQVLNFEGIGPKSREVIKEMVARRLIFKKGARHDVSRV